MNSTVSNEEEKKDKISKIFSKILRIIPVITAFITIFTPLIHALIPAHEFLYPIFIKHPFFMGVISSWLSATLITILILCIVNRVKKDKKEEYNEVFRQSEKWLQRITVVVLFYIAIHLASKALWPIGVPKFGESYAELWGKYYDKLDFFKYISPGDIFLFMLALCIIISIFYIAPKIRPHAHAYAYTLRILFFSSILISVSAALFVYFLPSLLTPEPSPDFINLDEVHGNDSEGFLKFLVDYHVIGWTESAEIRKYNDGRTVYISKDKNSAEIMIDEKMENATLKISDKTYDLILEKKNDKLRLSPSPNKRFSSVELGWLVFIFSVSAILSLFLFLKTEKQRKQIKAEFRDLVIFFCFTPAIVVAALAVAGNDLLRFPNFTGHIIVGVLLISGFFTLVTIATMSFSSKDEDELYDVLGCLAFASLASISGLTVLFSWVVPQEVLEGFGRLLSFAVAIIIVVLLYGFFYEKMQKYRFTEWWRREWRPIAIAISIVMIVVVSAFDPFWIVWTIPKLWIIPEIDIPMKVLVMLIALVVMFMLPKIIGLFVFRKHIQFRGLRPRKIPLPKYQGIVLVKVKTRQDSLKRVVKELDSMEGVYQTMVVRGEYDVCLIVEGVDSDDITKKILGIREIRDDVVDTTTLTDIREFFDREVR